MCGGEAVRVEQDRCAFTGLWSDSPHYRFHARNHFTRTERFANVVVRAEIETQQAVDFLDAGGENDDGNVGKSPHFAVDAEAILPGNIRSSGAACTDWTTLLLSACCYVS